MQSAEPVFLSFSVSCTLPAVPPPFSLAILPASWLDRHRGGAEAAWAGIAVTIPAPSTPHPAIAMATAVFLMPLELCMNDKMTPFWD